MAMARSSSPGTVALKHWSTAQTMLSIKSVSEAYSDELQADEKAGIKVTYRVVKPGYFVVSGSGAGKIIYQKTVLVGDVFKTLRLEYPEDQKAVFDPIVSTMSDCFHTNLKTQRPEDTKTTKLNNLRWWS